MQRAEEIADTEGVTALIFGSNDLTKDLKSRHTVTREPLLYSMSRCILAARAAGKQVIDGVHLDINDQNGFAVSCEQGRSLGFDGKSLIHPTQIDAANKVSALFDADDTMTTQHSICLCFRPSLTLSLTAITNTYR